jgi:hypothetical protein
MLRREDAELAAHEPGLAGLSLLFDQAAFSAVLQEHCPTVAILGVEAVYTRYKPGASCLVTYQVQLPQERVWVAAYAYPTGATQKIQKIKQGPAKPGPLGTGVIILDDLAIAITVFPNDRKLKSLTALAEASKRRQVLQKLLPHPEASPVWWDADWRILRYKPGRRCVAQLQSNAAVTAPRARDPGDAPTPGTGEQPYPLHDAARALLKVYNADDYENAACAAKRFVARGNLYIPRRLAASSSHRMVVTEWLSGGPLDLALYTGDIAPGALQGIGAALAELHGQEGFA